jgi:hypothetical protein
MFGHRLTTWRVQLAGRTLRCCGLRNRRRGQLAFRGSQWLGQGSAISRLAFILHEEFDFVRTSRPDPPRRSARLIPLRSAPGTPQKFFHLIAQGISLLGGWIYATLRLRLRLRHRSRARAGWGHLLVCFYDLFDHPQHQRKQPHDAADQLENIDGQQNVQHVKVWLLVLASRVAGTDAKRWSDPDSVLDAGCWID